MSREDGDLNDAKENGADPTGPKAGDGSRPARSRLARTFGVLRWFVLGVVVLAGLLVGAVQTGLGDHLFASRVRAALAATVGPDLVASVDEASIRIGADGRLAIEADAVRFSRRAAETAEQGAVLTSARSVRLLLDPLPLVFGELKVSSVEVDGIIFDASLAGRRAGMDWQRVRIDALDGLTGAMFESLDRAFRALRYSRTRSITLSDVQIVGIGNAENAAPDIRVDELVLSLTDAAELAIEGGVTVGDQTVTLVGSTGSHPEFDTIESVQLKLAGLERIGNPAFFSIPKDAPPRQAGRRFGLNSEMTVVLAAQRQPATGRPLIEADIRFAPGTAIFGGLASRLHESAVSLGYYQGAEKIEILPSTFNVANSSLPFSGGLIDLSRLDDVPGRGFAIELIVDDARSSPTDSSEPSLTYDAKAFARFLKFEQRLIFDEITVASPLGTFFASSAVRFGETSPEISFAATFERLDTTAAKQLWPHWIAKRPRQWVLDNLFGGTVHDGQIRVFVPEGRLAERPGRLELNEDQLRLSFEIEGARVGLAGDIPPLRDAVGRFRLRGTHMQVEIDGATAYFPTGRSIDVTGGTFTIAATDERPLMADLALSVEGEAAAAAELVSYRPVAVMERIGYEPSDFSGSVRADVNARFGLIAGQDPPPPEWAVDLDLDNVDISRPVEGRQMQAVTGTLFVDTDSAHLLASAEVDGIGLDLDIRQPIGVGSEVEPSRGITGTLADADRRRVAPGLDEIVSGPTPIVIEQTGQAPMSVAVDLTEAAVTVPGLNWKKAPGVAADARFKLDPDEEGLTITDFALEGDGFGAAGRMEIAGGKLASARFRDVHLSGQDDFNVSLTSGEGGGYAIDVQGRSIDLRSLIEGVRGSLRTAAGEEAGGGATPISVTADLERAQGFNGETLQGLSVRYEGAGAAPRALELRAVTSSGEAVVLTLHPVEDGTHLALNSGDAGAVARFANLYGRVRGGLVDLDLERRGEGPYRGRMTISNFAVIDEAQLQELVTARAAGSQYSLNDAVSGRIDTRSVVFSRGSADLSLGADGLTVANGVVRGPEIGTTFQGTVFDAEGNMAITGTFMPAYGLNSLFADIPLFGALLGNGRDRGLIGITFRLAGKASDPQLTVNPISAIAPGIFRQIFEF